MIQYPNRKMNKELEHKPISHVGRGMSLENDLNDSNVYYLDCDKAVIHKKPTPIQVVKVDYPSRNCAKIVEAYYKVASTTDYNGIYRSKAIDFEAKETNSKVSFTFKAIHEHQINHLDAILRHGGIAFVILRFTQFDETYLIDAASLITMYRLPKKKSITYQEVRSIGHLIKQGLTPRLRYLDIVDELYFNQ
ncbi:MAG: Holliday junction resolvase RecU [Erysipelotrichaceae bacterium]